MWLKCSMFTVVFGIKIQESEKKRKLQISYEHLSMYRPDSAGRGQSSHTIEPLFLRANSVDICFLSQEQLKLSFLRWAMGQSIAARLLWWDSANSHQLPLWKGKPIYLPSWCPHYYPAIPPKQWQDKGLLPGEPFWKAQPFFLDSVPIMTDTQRTTSHKASQWTGTHCLYVRARVSLLLITSWNTLWSCRMKKEHQRVSERSIKVMCFGRRNTKNCAWLKCETELAFTEHLLRVE